MSRRLEADELKTMINSFRCSDLVSLLGFVGRNKSGRKQELQQRALEILKNPASDVNQDGFKRKIRELYKAAQDEAKQSSNIELQQQQHHQQQQQQMMPHNMSGMRMPHGLAAQHANTMQQQRPMSNMNPYGPVSTQSYHHQAQRSNMTGNAVYQGGMNMSSNYPGGVYGQTSNQPIQSTPANPICNYGNTVLVMNPSYFSPATNFIFRKLPFYEIKHELLKPTILTPNAHLSLPPNLRTSATQEFIYSFVLNCDMANDLAMNRDISNGKNEFNVQAQLRLSAYDSVTNSVTEYDDFLPFGLVVRMNQRQCSLPMCSPNTRTGTESRRIPRPINITMFLKMAPIVVNHLTINWAPETNKTFVLTLNLVEKLSSEYLLNKLKERPTISVDVTKLTIREQYKRVIDDDDDTDEANADDDDIATTIVRVSLVCPLAKFRMMYPAKGKNCSHLQCFDGSAYISLNEKKPMWMCPVCNRTLYFDDLLIDQYFMDVLKNEELSSDCQEVQLLVDGTWKSYDEEASNTNDKSKNDSANSPAAASPTSSRLEASNGVSTEKHAHEEEMDHKEGSVIDMQTDANAALGGPVVDLTEEEEEDVLPTNLETPSNVNASEETDRMLVVTPNAVPAVNRSNSNEDTSMNVETSSTTEKNEDVEVARSPSLLVPPEVGASSGAVSSSGYISPNIISLDSPSPPSTTPSSPPNTLASLNLGDS